MADQNGKTQLVDAIARKIDGIPRSTEMFVCYLGLELVVRVCQWYILSFRLSMNIHLITLPRTHPTNKRSTFNLISRPETNPLDESYTTNTKPFTIGQKATMYCNMTIIPS